MATIRNPHSQGVLYLADRFNGPIPTELGVFQTQSKDGALTITAAKGTVLTLTAADGTTYTFNVATRALTP